MMMIPSTPIGSSNVKQWFCANNNNDDDDNDNDDNNINDDDYDDDEYDDYDDDDDDDTFNTSVIDKISCISNETW